MVNNNYQDAIYQILYLSNICNEDYLGGSGTGFVIEYNRRFFFITAGHCIADNINDLYITNFSYKECQSIPFSKIIRSKNNIFNEYNDVCILEISFDHILSELGENKENNIKNCLHELFQSKVCKKIQKTNYSATRKLKLIKKTNIYKRHEIERLEYIKSLENSLVQIKNLAYDIDPNFSTNDKLYILGYPDKSQSIDNEEKHIKQVLCGCTCLYSERSINNLEMHTGKILESEFDVFSGFSGSPVWKDKKIVGIVIMAGNGFVHFIDFHYLFEHIRVA